MWHGEVSLLANRTASTSQPNPPTPRGYTRSRNPRRSGFHLHVPSGNSEHPMANPHCGRHRQSHGARRVFVLEMTAINR